MKLGIFLSPGDSLAQQKQTGQLERLIDYYLKPYTRQFERVLIFSYGDKGFKTNLPNRVKLIPKPKFIHNYLYQLIMPLIQAKNLNFKVAIRYESNRTYETYGSNVFFSNY